MCKATYCCRLNDRTYIVVWNKNNWHGLKPYPWLQTFYLNWQSMWWASCSSATLCFASYGKLKPLQPFATRRYIVSTSSSWGWCVDALVSNLLCWPSARPTSPFSRCLSCAASRSPSLGATAIISSERKRTKHVWWSLYAWTFRYTVLHCTSFKVGFGIWVRAYCVKVKAYLLYHFRACFSFFRLKEPSDILQIDLFLLLDRIHRPHLVWIPPALAPTFTVSLSLSSFIDSVREGERREKMDPVNSDEQCLCP